MAYTTSQYSNMARAAARKQDWETVAACANAILSIEKLSAEGYFLTGLVERARKKPINAIFAFERALEIDSLRYDAAVELANQYSIARRNSEASMLLQKYEVKLGNSPMYLDLAATVYTEIGMPEKAWPLYVKANEIQPGIDIFEANLASCAVFLGKIEKAKEIYKGLLKRYPNHQRNHYHLSRLSKATDVTHIKQMQDLLEESALSEDKNIFLYFALGKELEDLGRWSDAFAYYKKGGDAVCSVAHYDVNEDIALIDKIIESCDSDWLTSETPVHPDAGTISQSQDKTPVFIVGLPRTGTTLTERILSSHSEVSSVGETLFMQMVLRSESGVHSTQNMNSEMIAALTKVEPSRIAKGYNEAISYRLNDEHYFIDKMPFNFLFLGFIAKAWPNAKIIHLSRNPMDACFAMYKQVFTWAYKYSYSLNDLGEYYLAYQRLLDHWRKTLKSRLIEIEYESVVLDTENETRNLLDKLGLKFEESCLNFESNSSPSTTASSVQVREKVHSSSIDKWKFFSDELEPLKVHLVKNGIAI